MVDELAAALGARLGGTVSGLRRLSGGASRITSAFDLTIPGQGGDDSLALVLQRDRSKAPASTVTTQSARVHLEGALLQAAHDRGVPVPAVVALGDGGDDGFGAPWLVVERLDGQTIPRKILRDPEWNEARAALTSQCGHALAGIHAIDRATMPGLPPHDPLRDPLPLLDALHEIRPALELGVRWLEAHRPPAGQDVTVHGDFRLGNLLVGRRGLRGVLDWELAHAGDAAEDIGWLCAPAWRFGGTGEVGGFGALDGLLAAYTEAGGEAMTPARVHWWQVYATVKWATICALQASAHLSGATRSVELAAIGRRVCESEWDLFVLLGVSAPPEDRPDEAAAGFPLPPFGRPTAAELVEAVREHFEAVMARTEGGEQFEARRRPQRARDRGARTAPRAGDRGRSCGTRALVGTCRRRRPGRGHPIRRVRR